MRKRVAGMVCDNLWYLGVEESGLYLLQGRDGSMLISGAMGYIAPDVLTQMDTFALDTKKITKLIILHAHFDHIGLVPFFKRRFPHLEIYGSRRAWEILSMPKAINTINAYSQMVIERMRPSINLDGLDLLWRDDISGQTIGDGDVFDLGGVEARIIETPGHSSCSVSVYIPQLKALIPSDAGGIPYKDLNIPTGNSHFTNFQKSLEKMVDLEVDYYCADHYGYIVGKEAQGFVASTIEAAARFRELVEQLLRKKRDVETTVQLLIAQHYQRNPDYFLSPEILTGVYRQMVRHISQCMISSQQGSL